MKQAEIIDGNQQMETGGEEMQIPRERGTTGKGRSEWNGEVRGVFKKAKRLRKEREMTLMEDEKQKGMGKRLSCRMQMSRTEVTKMRLI